MVLLLLILSSCVREDEPINAIVVIRFECNNTDTVNVSYTGFLQLKDNDLKDSQGRVFANGVKSFSIIKKESFTKIGEK